jgi:hypothetical protein
MIVLPTTAVSPRPESLSPEGLPRTRGSGVRRVGAALVSLLAVAGASDRAWGESAGEADGLFGSLQAVTADHVRERVRPPGLRRK